MIVNFEDGPVKDKRVSIHGHEAMSVQVGVKRGQILRCMDASKFTPELAAQWSSEVDSIIHYTRPRRSNNSFYLTASN